MALAIKKQSFGRRISDWIARFAAPKGMELPESGRSSVEDNLGGRLSSGLSHFGGLQPEIDFTYLELLRQLMIWNPLMNQFVENIKHLGNTGHHLIVDAANDAQAEKAVQRINETAARLWPQGAGVDGLLNQYFVDLAWSGALSSEDVVNFAAKRVEKVVIVPVEQIRFTWNGEDYLPNQLPKHSLGTGRSSLGLVPLNAETYRYYAMQVLGNVPYAKPPATAALEDITGPMADGKENLKRVIQKYGLVGFAAMQVSAKPQKPNESDEEYHTRMRGYLARVLSSVQGSFSQGLLGMFRDQKLEFENVTGNAQGLKDVWEIIEAQAFNGTAMQPAFFGRVHSTTETFADVVYALLDAQATNFRRPAKRRMERTYTLDLMMGGYQFNGVSVKFNRTPSRNALRDAQAEQTKVKTVIEKAKNGIISPDQAAQELGYDAAFDPDLLSGNSDAGNALKKIKAKQSSFSAIFRFNKDWNRYEHVPDRIEVTQTKADNVIRLKKKIV